MQTRTQNLNGPTIDAGGTIDARFEGASPLASTPLPLPLPLPPYVEPFPNVPVPRDQFRDSIERRAKGSGVLSVSRIVATGTSPRRMNGYIVTDVTFTVQNVLRGPAPPSQITVLGGTLDGETQGSEWGTQITIGETYYLFLRRVQGTWINSAFGPLHSRADGTIPFQGETFTPNDIVSFVTNL